MLRNSNFASQNLAKFALGRSAPKASVSVVANKKMVPIKRLIQEVFISKEDLLQKGISHGRLAFTGPDEVHIDLTNDCNTDCIGCWCRSALLEEKAMDKKTLEMKLPFPLVRKLLKDLAEMRCKTIKLIGGGEPFYYPEVMEVVREIRARGIECKINTNFTLVTERRAKELVHLGVDLMDCSVWASDAEEYVKTHPSATPKVWNNLKKNLLFLNEYKQKFHSRPKTRVYHVISNVNYQNIIPMIDFAIEVKADMVQFAMLDPVAEKTESLLLNEAQRRELAATMAVVRSRIDFNDGKYGGENGLYRSDHGKILVHGFDNFFRRVHEQGAVIGQYDKRVIKRCHVGWMFARVMGNGDVVPCLKAHKLPIGNIYKNSFKEIWNSREAQIFRMKGKNIAMNQEYFKQVGNNPKHVGCYMSCDNLWQNELAEGWLREN